MFKTVIAFLNNSIVINWVAPIITGLIVVAVPSILIRIFRTKNDRRKVDDANKRYLNAIRPYIIQKIKINSKFINDIRNVVSAESCIKDRYIYTALELRNKLILDITEDEYISEKDKKELIDFTYEVFNSFDVEPNAIDAIVGKGKSHLLFPDKFFIILIVSIIICFTLQLIYGKDYDMSKNIVFSICYINAVISGLVTFMSFFGDAFNSQVSNKNLSLKEKIINLFFEEVDDTSDKRNAKSHKS